MGRCDIELIRAGVSDIPFAYTNKIHTDEEFSQDEFSPKVKMLYIKIRISVFYI